MEEAAKSNRFKGILGVNKAQIVSSRLQPRCAQLDLRPDADPVLGKRFCRVLSWYDNEWGFSNRMVEVAAYFGQMA